MWIPLAVALFALPFLSATGRYVADTRDAVWFSPETYVEGSFSIWKPSPSLGNEQHEGILVPMALVVAVLREAGLDPWVAERVWHGALLFVAAAGTILLVDRLRGTRTVVAPLVAGLTYVATPYVFGYGLPTTGAFLPYVLLPALLLLLHRGLAAGTAAGAALFALSAFLMGGGNGAPQMYALVPALGLFLWVVAVERSVPVRRALRFGALAALFVVGLNAHWLFLLTSLQVQNVLEFSEQPSVINVASSYSESIRGLGFWVFYGGDRFGPWASTVRSHITSVPLVLAGFAVPVGALLSAWLVRWRYRFLFLSLAIVAVVVMAGVFPVRSPTPFGRFLLWAFDHVPGSAGLRTTYKFGATLHLSLAVLFGVGVEAALTRLRGAGYPAWARTATTSAVVAVVALNAGPLWTGELYGERRTASGIPDYWGRALDLLDERQGERYRAFFAPAMSGNAYRWGTLGDGIAAASPGILTVQRVRVPVGGRYGSNLLAAVEHPYQNLVPSSNAATLFRYLGVKDVVLQNDVDWQRAATARPAHLQALAADDTLTTLRTFGDPGQNVVSPPAPGLPDQATREGELELSPVQVLTLPRAVPIVRAEAGPPVVVSGDGFGLATLASEGFLEGNPPVLYSGDLTGAELAALEAQRPSFVVTDSNRRRVWSFAAVRRNFSHTLPPGDTIDGRPTGFALFGGRPGTESVARYEGAATVTASAYGSPFDREPEFRPVNAFDRNPATWWQVGVLADPVGEWVQVGFDRPITLSRVTLVALSAPLGRKVSSARVEFSDGTSVLTPVRPGENVVEFPARATSFVRVRIVAVSPEPVENGVGFSDILIEGVTVREVIEVPTDLFRAARETELGTRLLDEAPLTYVFSRSRTNSPLVRDEEVGISRRFEVPSLRRFELGGRAHLDPNASDDVIDTLLAGPSGVRATSSSRLLRNFNLRASAAIDGRPETAWVPERTVGEWLRIRFPRREVGRLVVETQGGPGRTPISEVEVSFSDGSSLTGEVPVGGRLELSFPPRQTTSVRLTVTRVTPIPGRTPPIGINEVTIPGVRATPVRPEDPVPCFTGDAFSLDGEPLPVRPVGTAGQMLAGANLPVTTCDDRPLFLSSGSHDLAARGVLQPDLLVVSAAGDVPGDPPAAPRVEATSRGGHGFDVEVREARDPFYLVIGQNHSSAWTARVDGESLGPPVLLDGYSAGWWIDRQGDFMVEVRYATQSRYTFALGVSGVSLAVVAAVLLFPLVRPRRPLPWRYGALRLRRGRRSVP